jgi:hypothetical protein
VSTLATSGASRAAASEGNHQPGEKRDIVVYANDEEYASFPILARTDQELTLLFQVQDLAKLRASGEHPHYQRAAVPRWATSRGGGPTWKIHETCPPLGRVRDIGYGSALLEQRPEEAKVGYGYFLYQTESSDGGCIWNEPVRLDLWGHPPYLLRLAGGNILLVYGYRRAPWEIRAILSRGEGRTWNMATLRTVHTFNPGNYDMGYPVATQLEDGSIVCAFYGYSTTDVGEKMPHGIFVSVFDEEWLASDRTSK